MTYYWTPSPNFDRGRPGPIKWVVWHDTEGQETEGSAQGVARNWFGITASQVSAHLVVDDHDVCECVKPADRAWHCGPKGNPLGYGIEIVGQASQTAAQWQDAYSMAALQNAAHWVLSQPVLAALPRRFLTDAELAAGGSGHITHAQVSRVLGGTTHTDPGPNFPFAAVTQLLAGDTVMTSPDVGVNLLVQQVVTGPDDTRWGWDAWPGGSVTADGKPDHFTAIDYLRKANQRAEDVVRLLGAISGRLDALDAKLAASTTAAGAPAVDVNTLAAKVADVLSARLAS